MFSNFVDLLIILTLNSNKLVTKGCQNIYNYIFYLNSKSKKLLVPFINLPNNKNMVIFIFYATTRKPTFFNYVFQFIFLEQLKILKMFMLPLCCLEI